MEFVKDIAHQVTVLHQGKLLVGRHHGVGQERSEGGRSLSRTLKMMKSVQGVPANSTSSPRRRGRVTTGRHCCAELGRPARRSTTASGYGSRIALACPGRQSPAFATCSTDRRYIDLATADLHVAYGQSEVLRGLNVSVAPNEIVAIMGRNGMGKTTLMKSLMGILPAKSGSVSMDGAELLSLRSYERVAKGLAYVPQGPHDLLHHDGQGEYRDSNMPCPACSYCLNMQTSAPAVRFRSVLSALGCSA